MIIIISYICDDGTEITATTTNSFEGLIYTETPVKTVFQHKKSHHLYLCKYIKFCNSSTNLYKYNIHIRVRPLALCCMFSPSVSAPAFLSFLR